MTEKVQQFLLKHTKTLQYVVNEKLAKRSGLIGKIFQKLEIGPRQYSRHSFYRYFKVYNYYWLIVAHQISTLRPVFSRFKGHRNGTLNYFGLILYMLLTAVLVSRFKNVKMRDALAFNQQDNPEMWYFRYQMFFPPSFLNNRISAHFIEINQIFSVEMFKRYVKVKQEILKEREKHSDKDKKTKYITNSNYLYETMSEDCPEVKAVLRTDLLS